MSWVKVKQGNVELLIPYQAFKDVYEKNGFSIIEDDKKPTHNTPKNTDKEVVEDGDKQQKANRTNKRNNTDKV